MDFRNALRLVETSFGSSEFQTKNMIEPFQIKSALDGKPERYDIKRTYRHIDRLYRMGFLKKKRVKRKVMLNTGQSRYRGYEHLYSLSNGGKKYLAYLKHGDVNKRPATLFDHFELRQIEEFQRSLPDDKKDHARERYRLLFPSRRSPSIEQRFPSNKSTDLVWALKQLRRENEKLKEQLSECRNQLTSRN